MRVRIRRFIGLVWSADDERPVTLSFARHAKPVSERTSAGRTSVSDRDYLIANGVPAFAQ
jgi:hypothetical protein